MQLNRSTDYAIQMLLYLAKAGKTVSSSKLAAAIGVSHRYLLQISAKLRAAGFIRAAHGPSGGLNLAKNPEDISLYDVILSMEGINRTSFTASEKQDTFIVILKENIQIDFFFLTNCVQKIIHIFTFQQIIIHFSDWF